MRSFAIIDFESLKKHMATDHKRTTQYDQELRQTKRRYLCQTKWRYLCQTKWRCAKLNDDICVKLNDDVPN